jgi:phenylpyruvate tautomerase PptA (4-oxalocrotonate tautomerase family)
MPIVDVQLVLADATAAPIGAAQAVADALGKVFGTPAGQTWVRISTLSASNYAENESKLAHHELPVFVAVTFANTPEGNARAVQASEIAGATAASLNKSIGQVHIEYAPPARGRIAFGGVFAK